MKTNCKKCGEEVIDYMPAEKIFTIPFFKQIEIRIYNWNKSFIIMLKISIIHRTS